MMAQVLPSLILVTFELLLVLRVSGVSGGGGQHFHFSQRLEAYGLLSIFL